LAALFFVGGRRIILGATCQARRELQRQGFNVGVLLSDTDPAAPEQCWKVEEGTVSKRARISRRT